MVQRSLVSGAIKMQYEIATVDEDTHEDGLEQRLEENAVMMTMEQWQIL